jgi:hypothetical protein
VNTQSPTPAEELFHVVSPRPISTAPTDSQADRAVQDFLNLLASLEAKHVRKSLSDEYLISNVFLRSKAFKADSEFSAFCRCNLVVAHREFKTLANRFRDPTTNKVELARMLPLKDIITDFVFDLIDIIPFLERKTVGFRYFRGGKAPDVHSWQLYGLSLQLAAQSATASAGPWFDHKCAQIAAIFVLRQAMELRFERIVGVSPLDSKHNRPKLRHGFHFRFILEHPRHFVYRGFDLSSLKPVYDWCSVIVHEGYQPYAWQSTWAHDIGGRILKSQSPQPGKGWDIANAVEVVDVDKMQSDFEEYFLTNYDHGSWQMTRVRPEALVATTSPHRFGVIPGYRQVNVRRNWRTRFAQILHRVASWVAGS